MFNLTLLTLRRIFSWSIQDVKLKFSELYALYLVTIWQIFFKIWDGFCPSQKILHHLVWIDPTIYNMSHYLFGSFYNNHLLRSKPIYKWISQMLMQQWDLQLPRTVIHQPMLSQCSSNWNTHNDCILHHSH